MNDINFKDVFLAILSAMVSQNRVIAPSAQAAVATNALEMTDAVMRVYAERQASMADIDRVVIDPTPDEREELAAALGLQPAEDTVVTDPTEITQIPDGSSDSMLEGRSL